MYKFWFFILSLSWLTWLMVETSPRPSSIKITNILCESTEPESIKFNQCLVQKNKKNITGIYVNMSHTNSTSLLINFHLLRQSNNKYSPFLYQTMAEFCEFVRNPSAKMFWGVVYEMIKPYSNINHTCPYDHDFVVAGLALQGAESKLISVPRGNYIGELKLSYGLSSKGKISVYCTKF